MKYAVIGAGSVGTVVTTCLLKSNLDVLLICKNYQINKIKKNGLEIIKSNLKIKDVKVTDDFSKLKDIDIVFLCVKSQDTDSVSKKLKNNIKKSCIIISLQNGVRNKQIIEQITGNKCISGIVLFNSILKDIGKVEITLKKGILLENDNDLTKLIDILNNSGIKTEVTDNINGCLYSKLVVNLQIAVTALTNQTVIESLKNKDTREIIVKTMKEGTNVIEKSNIKLETLPDIDPKKMIKNMEKYNSFILSIGSRLMGVKKNARNSMWQSISKNKPTEIDFINGEIVNLAVKNKIKAPINSKLVKIIKNFELENKKYYTPEELKIILN